MVVAILMPLSIQDIIDNVSLRTRLLSGAVGIEKPLRWAHVCELPDPSEWLGEGDLLMTTGIGIPHAPTLQREYVIRLAQAKVAGLMIGENMQAPDDIEALNQQASLLGFPVLMTHYSVPFSAVTKAVLDARQQVEDQRRRAVVRLYESARIGLHRLGLNGLLERLCTDVSADLYLFDTSTLAPWEKGLASLPPNWHQVISRRPLLTNDLVRCHDDVQEAFVMALPALPDAAILATGGQLLDYGVLHHIASILAIDLERVQSEHERLLRLGSELIDDLLHMRLTDQAAQDRLQQLACPAEHACIVLARPDGCLHDHWQQGLRRQPLAVLVRQVGQELVMVLANRSGSAYLQSIIGCRVGVSAPLGHGHRMPEALREARLALAHASASHPIVDYTDALDESSWLPRDLAQARRMYGRVLGTLSDYDEQNGSHLLHTLRVFLEHNRSWQKSSQILNVHKQTLVYRIRRIEEITGRSLDDTESVVVLWIALRCLDFIGGSGL